MNSIFTNNQLYLDASSIKNVSIDDKLLRQLSTNVRKLAMTLQDWIELSTDWDIAVGRLRRADWLLRNDPAPLNANHPAIIDLIEGIRILEGLFKNMSLDIQQNCTNIIASGRKILELNSSELTNMVLRNMQEANPEQNENILIVRQESIRVGVINWLKEIGINHWQVFTANQFIHSGVNCRQMLVVGLTQDYPISLFNSVYPEGGICTFSHSWIKEQNDIPGYFSDIAQIKIEKKILTNLITVNHTADTEKASNYLEPSK